MEDFGLFTDKMAEDKKIKGRLTGKYF